MQKVTSNKWLYRDAREQQQHFKMYKKGKLWLESGLAVFTAGIALTQQPDAAQAATEGTTVTGEATGATAADQQITLGQAATTAQAVVETSSSINEETTETDATSVTPEVNSSDQSGTATAENTPTQNENGPAITAEIDDQSSKQTSSDEVTDSVTPVVQIKDQSQKYDSHETTVDPAMFRVEPVTASSDIQIPDLTADDFDLSGITSMNVGEYKVQLSDQGIAKIQTANPAIKFDASDVQSGTLSITPRDVYVQGTSSTKKYDGHSFQLTSVMITNVPVDDPEPDYTETDISQYTDVGTYPTVVTINEAAYPNYEFFYQPSQVVIEPATDFDVTVVSASKVYDGDASTDPALFEVTLPDYVNAPEWTAADFDVSGIDSQKVGTYSVTLSAQGIADLQAANPKNIIVTADNIVAGTFEITPAKIATDLKVEDLTKVYDGDASTDPTYYDIELPKGMENHGFMASNFDFSAIRQDVGTYPVTLNQSGIDRLQEANPGYLVTADQIIAGSLTITPAPITITGPTVNKYEDGTPYPQDELTATIEGQPVLGDPIEVTFGDLSADLKPDFYPIKVITTASDNPNYQVSIEDGQLAIFSQPVQLGLEPPTEASVPNMTANPQAKSLAIENTWKRYDNDATTNPTTFKVYAPTAFADFKIPELTAADFDVSGLTSQNVGSYEVKLSDAGLAKIQAANPDYTMDASDVLNGIFTIDQAPVVIEAVSGEKVYDGYPINLSVGLIAFVPYKGEMPVYSQTDITQFTDVGVYPTEVTIDETAYPNYEFDLRPDQVVITPATDFDVTITSTSKVYDGDVSTDPTSFEVTLPAHMNAPEWTAADFDTSGIDSQNVGTYAVTLSAQGIADLQAANPKNFIVTADNIVAGNFNITPAPLTVTAPSVTKTYDGQPYDVTDLTATVAGVPTAGTPVSPTLSDLTADTAVGTYPIDVIVDAAANPNYTMTTVAGQLIITPQLLTGATDEHNGEPVQATTLTIGNVSKTYDNDATTDPTTYPVTGPSAYADFVVPPLTPADFDLSGIDDQAVGQYPVTLSSAGLAKVQATNPGYEIDATAVTAGTLTITPAAVTISAPSVTKTYDGQPYRAPLTATITGVPAKGTTPTYHLTDMTQAVAAGTYVIGVTASATENANYTITGEPGTLTIIPTTVAQVTIEDTSKGYDGTSATDPTIFTVALPTGMTPPTWTASDFDVSGITQQNVGQYPITLSTTGLAKLQALNPDYALTAANVVAGTFTITPAPITIMAPTITKIYDGQSVTDPLTAIVLGVPAYGTTPDYTLSDVTTTTDVGTYPLTVTVGENANYDVHTTAGRLTITPAAAASVTVGNRTKLYDGDVTTVPTTYRVTVPAGMTAPTWHATDFDLSEVDSPNVGTYTVTLSAAGLAKLQDANPNYQVTPATVTAGSLRIIPTPVTVSAPQLIKTEDGQPYTLLVTATITGLPAKGAALDYTLTDMSEQVVAGQYVIDVNVAPTTNYTITTVAGSLTIMADTDLNGQAVPDDDTVPGQQTPAPAGTPSQTEPAPIAPTTDTQTAVKTSIAPGVVSEDTNSTGNQAPTEATTAQRLPQTGDARTTAATLAELGIVVLGLLGLSQVGSRKRR